MTASQREDGGGSSKRAVVSAWPLAFCATRQRHRKKKKVRDQRRYQGRRLGRRGTCCETVEDAASFPDLRLKSTLRSHHQRPAQKHTIRGHHVVSSCAVIHWSLSPDQLALTHERESATDVLIESETILSSCVAFWSNASLYSADADRWPAAKHPGSTQRDVTPGPHARRTRRNEAGDAVAGGQDSTTRGVRNLQLMDILTTAGRDSIVAIGREARNHARTGAATAKSVPAVRPVWHGSTGVHWKLGPWAHDTYKPETSPWSGLPRCGSWTVGLAWCVVPLDHGEVICLLPEPVRASGNPIVSNDHRHKHG